MEDVRLRSLQTVSILLELREMPQRWRWVFEEQWAHLGLELSPHPILFVRLDHYMVVIQVLDDEAHFLVHRQQDLLHGRVAVRVGGRGATGFRRGNRLDRPHRASNGTWRCEPGE